ncbi:hypothetical protein JNL27_13325 [bacterium]|nr:hypothetical protein [bacterium]
MKRNVLWFIMFTILWISGCPNDSKKDASLTQAKNVFKDGDYEAALVLYEDLIETEGSTARVGAAWCYIRLNDYATANTYFSLSADDSLMDGYAGWTFTAWAANSPQVAIERANFVLRKNAAYVLSLDSRVNANHLIWIQASSYFQLGNYTASVEKIKLLDASFNPNLNASNISQLIAEKLQVLGAVHF